MRPQSMAQTVADLEAEGFVERSRDPTDRRRALVSLTKAGRDLLTSSRRQREGWLVRAIEELPDADRETIERAVVLLGQLADAEI
jgi:DNA-binding MarR family transcriptional regulator